MAKIVYNKSYTDDVKNIDFIIDYFEKYKTHLQNKECEIYKDMLPKIINIINMVDQELTKNLCNFKKTDSDNEENYSNEYKQSDNEDSISNYDTDTDDEDTNKLRKKLIVKTSHIKNHYELIKSQLPVKFKKI